MKGKTEEQLESSYRKKQDQYSPAKRPITGITPYTQ